MTTGRDFNADMQIFTMVIIYSGCPPKLPSNFDLIFTDISLDESRWPWPWMLENSSDVTVVDVEENESGSLDMDFLAQQLGKFKRTDFF